MNDCRPAINIIDLHKNYRIYDQASDRLKEALHPFKKRYHRSFSALKSLSIQINRGESVAIVGKNGSGKSTLLKIITGVVTPSSGKVEVNGKIAAILELGSGFNPEMTGLENIYLNSTLNGLSRSEINQQLQSIIDFAELGDFIKQPVKTYSSGMRARLAFSVSIHVQPDILIVDEALSVGDAAFARKCFARMEQIRASGATIIFVSHSMSSVVSLCSRAIWINQGELVLDGEPKPVTDLYLKYVGNNHINRQEISEQFFNLLHNSPEDIQASQHTDQTNNTIAQGRPLVELYNPNLISKSVLTYEEKGGRVSQLKILSMDGRQVNTLLQGRNYTYSYQVELDKYHSKLNCGFAFKTLQGIVACGGGIRVEPTRNVRSFMVHIEFTCLLHEGTYFLNAGIKDWEGNFMHRIVDAIMIQVKAEPSNINYANMICNLIVQTRITPLPASS